MNGCPICGYSHPPDGVCLSEAEAREELTFKALREANASRVRRWHGGPGITAWSNSDWAVATMGEVGEAANIVKKMNRIRDGVIGNKSGDDTMKQLRAKLADEMADFFIYGDLWALRNGIDVAAAIRRKFNEVSERQGFPERL